MMPRRFARDLMPEEVDSSLVGYSDGLNDVSLSQPQYDHRNPVTGDWCGCGYGSPKQFAKTAAEGGKQKLELQTDVARKIWNQNQKVFRPDGPLGQEALKDDGRILSPEDSQDFIRRVEELRKTDPDKADLAMGDGEWLNAAIKSYDSFAERAQQVGPQTLQYLDNAASKEEVPELLPWLASLVKKGVLRPKVDLGEEERVVYGMNITETSRTNDFDWWLGKIAKWFAAKQAPLRQGRNIADMSWDEAVDISEQHDQWLKDEETRKRWQKTLLKTEDQLKEFDQRRDPNLTERYVLGLDEAAAELGVDLPEQYKDWRVVKLTDGDTAEIETAILGHCIGSTEQPYREAIDQGAIDAFSLRDENGIPKVSWHFNPSDGTLAHIQGKSGYPKEEWRDLISIFNNATGRDDDEGEEGHEEDLSEYGYGGIHNWHFGDISDADDFVSIIEDPYDVAYYHADQNLAEDCEFEADVDVEGVANDIVRNYEGWHPKLMSELMTGPRYGVDMSDVIQAVLNELEEKWNDNSDYVDYYDPEEEGPPPPFNLQAIETMVNAETVDGHLLDFLKGVGADEETPLGQLKIPQSFGLVSEHDQYPANEYEIGAEDNPWHIDERTKELKEQGVMAPRTHKSPHIRNEPNEPRGLPVEVSPTQPVWRGGMPEAKGDGSFGYVAPNDNPNLIAEEYWRIWQTEGQQAAAEWYYNKFPDQQAVSAPRGERRYNVPVQLTSSWNDLLHQ